MVGQIAKEEETNRALKIYITKEREAQRLKNEAEAERSRKRKEQDEKKLKDETEFKATKEKLGEVVKKHEQLQQYKAKLFEHLKKLLNETNKHVLAVEDLTRLYEIGLAVTCVSTVSNYQSVHPASCVSTTIVPRSTSISTNIQYKTSTGSSAPIQMASHQKRNRSPSPTNYRTGYNYKQAAGPHAFQKMDDSHRNHEYSRSYLFKPASTSQSVNYGPFYSSTQSVTYTIPSAPVHSNATVYNNFNSNNNRENVEVLCKTPQAPSVSSASTSSQHSSLYPSHRSIQSGQTSSLAQNNHVSYLIDHSKNSQAYSEDKYYMVRPTAHVSVHGGVLPVQQANKHGSITSGYPVRPVATQISPQTQLHLQQHSGHHVSQANLHSSSQSHHSSLPPHHSAQSQLVSAQPPQPLIQQQSIHHQTPYQSSQSQLHHAQSHQSSQLSPQSHSSQTSTASAAAVVSQQQSHHSNHHQSQHLQQIHVPSHLPSSHSQSSPHHQLIHHSSSSIHHTSSQHAQQIHQTLQQQQQQQSQPPQLSQIHHSQIQPSHIQSHISSHQSQPSQHQQSQQSQSTNVATSQTYVTQINSVQSGNRVVFSQSNMSH